MSMQWQMQDQSPEQPMFRQTYSTLWQISRRLRGLGSMNTMCLAYDSGQGPFQDPSMPHKPPKMPLPCETLSTGSEYCFSIWAF